MKTKCAVICFAQIVESKKSKRFLNSSSMYSIDNIVFDKLPK